MAGLVVPAVKKGLLSGNVKVIPPLYSCPYEIGNSKGVSLVLHDCAD